jgi:hypothetical protein
VSAPWTACTAYSTNVQWDPGSPALCAAGSGCYYLGGTIHTYRTFPSGQHTAFISIPVTAPRNIQYSWYYEGPGSAEQVLQWNSGTQFAFQIDDSGFHSKWEIAFRDGGTNPTWLTGQPMLIEYKNYITEPACGPAVPCAYGTRLTSGAQFVYYLTPGFIDVILGARGLAWLAPVFTAFWFTTINAQDLCGALPPPWPTINLHTLETTYDSALKMLKAIMWPYVCECVPGTPAPSTPIPPSATQPTGWPAYPTFSCSNTDLCAAVLGIQKQLAAMQERLGQDLGLTTLIQRYRVPFAYIKGAKHSNLSASGSFSIPRCIGVLVEVKARTSETTLAGNPPYLWDVGWMSILTADGTIEERRLVRTTQLWFPQTMQDATTFGFFCTTGTVIDVTELYAEP